MNDVYVCFCRQVARVQQLWDDEVRSSRSNSISSSSSQDSNASNPPTPRSHLHDHCRSPYVTSRATRPTIPSPLSCVQETGAMRKTKMDSMTSAMTTDEPQKRMSPVLKTALSLPPLHGQETWFHQPKDSQESAAALDARRSPDSHAKSDSESMEVDVSSVKVESDAPTRSESPVSSCAKFKKPKRSFLERFSPEPSATPSLPQDLRTSPTPTPEGRQSPASHAPAQRDDSRAAGATSAAGSTSALMQHFVAMQQINKSATSLFR